MVRIIPGMTYAFENRFSLGYHISDEWTLIGVVDKTESYRQFGTSKNKSTHEKEEHLGMWSNPKIKKPTGLYSIQAGIVMVNGTLDCILLYPSSYQIFCMKHSLLQGLLLR